MDKEKKHFTTLNLKEDIQQFISEFVNKDPNLDMMTIIVEPKQISLHLFLSWLKGAIWTSEQRSRQIRSPRWGGID